ncbi:MAG: hypothetical protein OXK82_05540 [Deltaproteobacteria bacterium]|nr:hypothetical protein [Deltaproteobacteria bacterium]
MWFWARAGAGATCIYTGERWIAGMTFESVPENVWLGIAACSLLFIIAGDTIRWFHKKRKAKADAQRAAVKAQKDEADRQEAQQILRDLRSRDVSLADIRTAISGLKQEPLGDSGHTYASLPDGTNIITMADGTIRLALPVRLSPVALHVEGGGSATLKRPPAPSDDERLQ